MSPVDVVAFRAPRLSRDSISVTVRSANIQTPKLDMRGARLCK